MASRLSLRTRFVAVASACLLPLLIVLLLVLDRSLENSRDQLFENEELTANIVASGLDQTLVENEEVLRNLSQPEPIQSMDPVASQELLGTAKPMRPSLPALFTMSTDLQIVASAGGVDPAAYLSAMSFAAETALTTGEAQVTDPISIPDAELDVVAMLLPILPAGGEEGGLPVGIIGSFLSVDRLARVFLPVGSEADQDTDIAVVSGSAIVASDVLPAENPADVVAPLDAAIEQGIAGQRVQTTFDDQDGNERMAVVAPIAYPGAEWAVVVSATSPTAYGPNQDLLRYGLIGLAAAVLSALIISAVLGELTARPLRTLTDQAAAIASGDLETAVEPAGASEIVALGESVQDMSDQLTAKVRDLETAQEETEDQALQLRELLRRTVRFQEDERRRIASDIHDAVSPLITGALYQIRALTLSNGHGNGVHDGSVRSDQPEELSAVSDLLERSMDELHNVIFDLRPPDLDDVGVEAAIERYVFQINRAGMQTTLEVSGEPRRLSSEVRLGIYRIVQEALHNSLRHAQADEAKVLVEWLDDRLCVTITDDGSGFDPERASRGSSLGLASMRERAAAIGASLEIVTRAGTGTAIIVERPLESELVPDRASEFVMEAMPSEGVLAPIPAFEEMADSSGSAAK